MPEIITALVGDDGVIAGDPVGLAPWWSFTKTVLAAATLALVAQRRLALDEPHAGHPFTLRQILSHRSGLTDYGLLPAYHRAVAAAEAPWPLEEMLRRTGAERLRFAPGAGFSYSNIGYCMVARTIEQAADAPLGPALDRLVLQPLDIGGVLLAETPAALDGTLWGNARRYHPGWVYHRLLVGPATAAGLLLHRLLAGHLLPPELLSAMLAAFPVEGAVVADRPWRSAGYGLGLMIGEGEAGGEFTGHTGGGPGSSIAVYRREGGAVTAVALAALEAPGPVERAAMVLSAR